MSDALVRVHELTKRYPKRPPRLSIWSRLSRADRPRPEWHVAVDGVSFEVEAGQIFGLLGPNGAGKTTTIKMLCTLLEPSGGWATVNGYDVAQQAGLVRQSLGAVLTGERSVYWKLTARENLQYFAALYHIPRDTARRRIDELLERLDLASRADELVERYSSGMKQRVAIAKAMLPNPPVLLLDEPTIGLDPQSARNLRELILEARADGRTVLLTTHYMEEADQLSDQVGIIDGGKVIALGTPAELKRAIQQQDILQLEVERFDPSLCAALHALPTVEQVACHHLDGDGAWSVVLHAADSRAALPGLIEVVGSRAGRIRHLEVVQPTLEDVFISLTGRQLRD